MAKVKSLIFRQMFEQLSSTYTYLLACARTKDAIIIDTVMETVERDAKIIKEIGVNLIYVADTHVHADHVTGSGELKKRFERLKSLRCIDSGSKADVFVRHGDMIRFGDKCIEVRSTPGHTNGCVTFVLHDDRIAFTGDALLIRGCGRTDFQDGDARRLYRSVHSQIFSLPRDYVIYPSHDYRGLMSTSIDEEMRCNPRMTRSEDEFVHIMNNLKLSYPKQIDKAVPANLVCGIYDLMDEKTKAAIRSDQNNLNGHNKLNT